MPRVAPVMVPMRAPPALPPAGDTVPLDLWRGKALVTEGKTLVGFMQLIGGDLSHVCAWLNEPATGRRSE